MTKSKIDAMIAAYKRDAADREQEYLARQPSSMAQQTTPVPFHRSRLKRGHFAIRGNCAASIKPKSETVRRLSSQPTALYRTSIWEGIGLTRRLAQSSLTALAETSRPIGNPRLA